MRNIDPLIDWNEPQSIKLWGSKVLPNPALPWLDYINYYIHPDVVSVVGRLLIPAFVEHEGGVFLQDRFTISNYDRWNAKLSTINEVEKIINHQHVYDLFSIDEEISDSSFETVAKLMSNTLHMALFCSFPERKFHVYVSNSEVDYGPTVGFYSDI